jgi:plastocyanin
VKNVEVHVRKILVIAVLLLTAGCAPASAATANNPGNSTANNASSSATAETYTVLVGAEDPTQGADLEAYFPGELHIHVGDTVIWKLNSNEIHTVTFLAGQAAPQLMLPVPGAPEGAMMLNPEVAYPVAPDGGQYDGTGTASSGIMGPDQGQAQTFQLTFTKAGTYAYNCVVHGVEDMKGTIVVENADTTVPSPSDAEAQGQQELTALMGQVPALAKEAQSQIPADTQNPDGTTTHHVLVGYNKGQIDLMYYFPNSLTVHPGDTVMWDFSKSDVAPHTITFLNGANEPPLVLPQQQQSGPPLLTINPAVAAPQNVDKPLTDQGIFSSGMIDPSVPGPHTFSLKVGDYSGTLTYQCLLHNENGMEGTLNVTPAG